MRRIAVPKQFAQNGGSWKGRDLKSEILGERLVFRDAGRWRRVARVENIGPRERRR